MAENPAYLTDAYWQLYNAYIAEGMDPAAAAAQATADVTASTPASTKDKKAPTSSSLLNFGDARVAVNANVLSRFTAGANAAVSGYQDPDFISGAGSKAERMAHGIALANMTITKDMSEADRKAIQKARKWYTGQIKGGRKAGWTDASLKSIRRGKDDKGKRTRSGSSKGAGSSSSPGNDSSSEGSSGGSQPGAGAAKGQRLNEAGNPVPDPESYMQGDKLEEKARERRDKVAADLSGSSYGATFSNDREEAPVPSKKGGKKAGFRQTKGTTVYPAKNKKAQQKLEGGVPTIPGAWGSQQFAEGAVAREAQVAAEKKKAGVKARRAQVAAAQAPRSAPERPKAAFAAGGDYATGSAGKVRQDVNAKKRRDKVARDLAKWGYKK